MSRLKQFLRDLFPPYGEKQDYAYQSPAEMPVDARVRVWESLTPREQEITGLICLGYTNRQIMQHLMISKGTVKTHVRNILQKFDLHSKREVQYFLRDWDFRGWDRRD